MIFTIFVLTVIKTREIWKLAVEDTSYLNMELKAIYNKKLSHEKRALRQLVKDTVANHIQTTPQSFASNLHLVGTMKIIGYTATVKKYRNDDHTRPYDPNNIYMVKIDETFYYEVINQETKFLIENVLIPLDLKWKINEYEKTLQLSWDHWKEPAPTPASTK